MGRIHYFRFAKVPLLLRSRCSLPSILGQKSTRAQSALHPSPKIDSPLKRRQPRPLDPADNPRFPSRAYSSFLFPRSPPSSRGGVATIGRTDVARTSKQTGNVRVPYDCAACTSLLARSSPARRSSFALPSVHRSIAIVDRVDRRGGRT